MATNFLQANRRLDNRSHNNAGFLVDRVYKNLAEKFRIKQEERWQKHLKEFVAPVYKNDNWIEI